MKNKVIIFLVFVIVLLSIFLIVDRTDDKSFEPLTNQEAEALLAEVFGEDIIRLEGEDLVITSNDHYTILVVGDRYVLVDYATVPPTIHQYYSIREDIEVTILEIYEDGSYLVQHDDHTHIVTEELPEGAKVGDKIYIKDPHTYLYDYHHSHDHDHDHEHGEEGHEHSHEENHDHRHEDEHAH